MGFSTRTLVWFLDIEVIKQVCSSHKHHSQAPQKQATAQVQTAAMPQLSHVLPQFSLQKGHEELQITGMQTHVSFHHVTKFLTNSRSTKSQYKMDRKASIIKTVMPGFRKWNNLH